MTFGSSGWISVFTVSTADAHVEDASNVRGRRKGREKKYISQILARPCFSPTKKPICGVIMMNQSNGRKLQVFLSPILHFNV